jgi:hypothetical protein
MRRFAFAVLLIGCKGGAGSSEPPKPAPDRAVARDLAGAAPTHASHTSSAASTSASSQAQPDDGSLSVTQLRASNPRPASTHRLRGFVVKRYACPPCPPNALCKPCMGNNIVLSDDDEPHELYDLDERDVIVFTDTPMSFALGAQLTIEVRVLDRQSSNKGIADLELVKREPMQECPHRQPPLADSPCKRPHGRPCTYTKEDAQCRTLIATCVDGRWKLDCVG